MVEPVNTLEATTHHETDLQDASAPRQSHRIFPQRLSDNYKSISNLIKSIKRSNTDVSTIIEELGFLLNDSMPQNEVEHSQHIQEQLHYHRDPVGYYQHLNEAKLRFLVLWTDYKTITNHFKVRKTIHIRWTGERYECQVYDNTKRIKAQTRNRERMTSINDGV
jgi:hypothetical protein